MNPNQQQPAPPQPQQQPQFQGQQPMPTRGAPQPQQQQQQQQQQPQQQQQQQPQYQQPGQPPHQPQQPSAPPSNPNSTQNTLEIAEIRDGLVIMNDGSYRSVLMAQSINFDLMSPQERESVEFSYQSFLNSLYFDIQISIRSQKVDLQPYIQKLEKLHGEQDNMLLAYLMDDYINYIQILAQETNIMDKQFYITIPYFPIKGANEIADSSKGLIKRLFGGGKPAQITIHEADLEAAKTELRNRVQSVVSSLMQLGVQSVPLDTQELIELYYDVYNPDTATRQRSLSRRDFNVPVVSKGDGLASAPHLDAEKNQ